MLNLDLIQDHCLKDNGIEWDVLNLFDFVCFRLCFFFDGFYFRCFYLNSYGKIRIIVNLFK